MGDRPHTISSAYEKGHQRPQLQPYTFSPPESTLTIPEDVTGEGGAINGSQDSLPPPPPPKPAIFRYNSTNQFWFLSFGKIDDID